MDLIIQKSSILNPINRMLRITNDPTKLAYIHWLIYYLFDEIKSSFLVDKKMEKTYYFEKKLTSR